LKRNKQILALFTFLKKKNKNFDRAASSFLPPARPSRTARCNAPAPAFARARVAQQRGSSARPACVRALSLSLSLIALPHLSSPTSALLLSPARSVMPARWPAGDHDFGRPSNRSNPIYSSPRTSPDHSRDQKRPRGNTSPAMAGWCSR
jgi:hypothetical protein